MPRQAKSVPASTISSPEAPASRRDQKRAAILAAAKQLLFAQGYAGASMDDIVARVGGSKATLYSHFASKDELLLALVEEVVGGYVARAMSADPKRDFAAFLHEFGRAALAGRSAPDIIGLERLAAAEAIRFPDFGRAYYERGILPARKTVSTLFAAAMEAGALRRVDPMRALDQFMEMCCGWLWRRQIWGLAPAPSQAQIDANVDAAAEAFMHGYAAPAASRRKRKAAPPAAPAPAPDAPAPDADQPSTRREHKRAAIVAAAKELFFAEGYAAVSMNRIVERVGGSKATLYSHFPSKQQLLFAVVQDVEAARTLRATPAAPASGDADAFRRWLGAFGRLAVGRLTSHEFIALQRLAAGEAAQLPEVGAIFFEAGVTPAFAQFVGVFAAAMQQGVLRTASAQTAAEHFVEMCTGGAMRQVIWGIRAPPTEKEIAAQVDAAVATFMGGAAALKS